jgi:RimJ/RimL family protein N-acetyltransferase
VSEKLLPSRDAWHDFYRADYRRPLEQRENYSLVWQIDGTIVGFSTTDHITFGVEAFMHLHILSSSHRRSGLGTEFVRLSAAEYFRVLSLQRLFCRPNAFNVAPTGHC